MGLVKNIDKKILLFIILAFIFSVAIRFIWIYQFHNQESFFWNNQLMINTNDGYYYAEGARDIVAGTHQPNDLSPINTATSKLTALFAKVLPFSFETIILFMPAFLSSLIVIPLIFIGKNIKNGELGFIAALLTSIAWSYYNRTMVGYYDTDMLNIVFPTFLLWSLVLAFQTKESKYLLFSACIIILYNWWYPQSYSLIFALFGLILLYTLVFERNNLYLHKLLIFMLLSMINLQSEIKLALVIMVFILFLKDFLDKRGIFLLFGLVLIALFVTGGVNPVLAQLKGYIFRDTTTSTGELNLHFFTVMQTVREAGSISFEVFANRISGHIITFFVSLIGYVYLCFKHRVMLLGLPMLGLGFLAYSGGLRFTVYAVPIMALGIAYLIVKVSDFLEKSILKYLFMALLTAVILIPNILHVNNYKVPTVFNTQEVQVLDNLKRTASREDYVVSWWDYGYPIRYYADVKTLVDGGKHSGEVNFAPSFILTHTQQEAANMARLDVEYTEMAFREKNNTQSNIAEMAKEYGFDDVNDFLLSLKDDIKLPKKTRDIFIYLPYRMMGIFPTIARFSYIDLMSGKSKKQPFFFQTSNVSDNGKTLQFARSVSFDKTTSLLTINKNKIPVKSFYAINYNKSGKLTIQSQALHQNGMISIVFARAYNTFFLLDNSALNSTYVQLFLFEKYDKKLFEPIELNPYVKVYKLKQ